MAVGTKSRRQVYADLKALAGSVSGATYTDRIDVREGPQGNAHTYYSLGGWSDSTDPEWRGKPSGKVLQRYSVDIVLAWRLQPKEQETARLAVRDVVDDLQQAFHSSLVAEGVSNVELSWLGADEVESASGEWIEFVCRVEVRALFDLTP